MSSRLHTREDSGIRLDRELRWWHDDQPIEHPKIIEAFNAGLAPTEDGRFKLTFGNDWCFVQVEDAAYAVLAIDASPGALELRLSDRTVEKLDPQTLFLNEQGVLACRVKGRRAIARFSRDAQFAIGEWLSEEEGRFVLRLGDQRFVVG